MLQFLRRFSGLHWLLLLLTVGLMGFGVLSIESAARHLPGGGAVFAGRQLLFALAGLGGMAALALFNYRWVKFAAWPLYGVSLVLLLLVTLYGEPLGDSRRAFSLGPLSFQPSQLAILAGILVIPVLLEQLRGSARLWLAHPLSQMLGVCAVCVVPMILVVAQGDMGSALVWLPVIGVTLLAAGLPLRYLSLSFLIGVLMLPWAYFFILPKVSERGSERIETFVDMALGRDVDIQGDAHAAHYVSMSVAQGGLHGIGWHAEDNSLHAKRFIPWRTAHNDYIFGVIGAEHGFYGSLLLILAYVSMMLCLLHISTQSRDFLGRMICVGALGLFVAHVFENIGMCIRLTPITGIPLPLVSYGGSFLLICLLLLGLVQAVWTGRDEPA